jgi:chromosomal replication initiation ATPase DnaA
MMRYLVREAAERYELLEREVLSHGNAPRKVAARAHIAGELRKQGRSLPEIGRLMGGYHHTTILNLLRPKLSRPPIHPADQPWDRDAPDLSGEWAI